MSRVMNRMTATALGLLLSTLLAGCASTNGEDEPEASSAGGGALTSALDVAGTYVIDFHTNKPSMFEFGWDLEGESVGEEGILNHRAHAELTLSSNHRFTVVIDIKRCRYNADWYASGENKCFSSSHEQLDPNANDPRAHTVVTGTYAIERRLLGLWADRLTLTPDPSESGKYLPYRALTISKDSTEKVNALDPDNYESLFLRKR